MFRTFTFPLLLNSTKAQHHRHLGIIKQFGCCCHNKTTVDIYNMILCESDFA